MVWVGLVAAVEEAKNNWYGVDETYFLLTHSPLSPQYSVCTGMGFIMRPTSDPGPSKVTPPGPQALFHLGCWNLFNSTLGFSLTYLIVLSFCFTSFKAKLACERQSKHVVEWIYFILSPWSFCAVRSLHCSHTHTAFITLLHLWGCNTSYWTWVAWLFALFTVTRGSGIGWGEWHSLQDLFLNWSV